MRKALFVGLASDCGREELWIPMLTLLDSEFVGEVSEILYYKPGLRQILAQVLFDARSACDDLNLP